MRRSAPDSREFLFLISAMMCCQALAVDVMLPALPTIAIALSVTDANRMQWVITAYTAGMGIGQLFWGVASDRFGRRPILLTGLVAFVLAAALSGFANSFTALLVWRFVHGLAGSSMVVSRSVVRDIFEGRQMARVMSLTFIVFLLVPIIAPSLGQMLLLVTGWRELFITFTAFGAIIFLWVLLRLPETLHPEYRYSLTVSHVAGAARRVLTDRASVWYTLSQSVIFGSVLAYVSTVPQVFQTVFRRPALMPTMFAVCAIAMAASSFGNSRIVERYGMRRVSQTGILCFMGFTGLHVLTASLLGEWIVSFVLLQSLMLGSIGFINANCGAMAMENMSAVAGIAAALQGSVGAVGGALVGAGIGYFFNGTTLPFAIGVALCGLVSLLCVLIAERGRLFRPHHAGHTDAGVAHE
jgi:DHA1 family bicyclomycin/chloramphenicol resistance-like MFS transporter